MTINFEELILEVAVNPCHENSKSIALKNFPLCSIHVCRYLSLHWHHSHTQDFIVHMYMAKVIMFTILCIIPFKFFLCILILKAIVQMVRYYGSLLLHVATLLFMTLIRATDR